jgi:hypothetical protein
MKIIHAPVPPAPPLSGQQGVIGGINQQAQGLIWARPSGQPTPPTPPPVPKAAAACKCRGRGWVFVSVLDGTTKRCGCGEAF